MNCIICSKQTNKPRSKYCSATCKQKDHYNKRKINNPNTSYSQYTRADKRKKEFIQAKGGCCKNCGYNKNYAALSFHHRTPNDKSFSLDCRNIGNRNIKSLLKELDKCDLLCMNCHMETHYPDLLL